MYTAMIGQLAVVGGGGRSEEFELVAEMFSLHNSLTYVTKHKTGGALVGRENAVSGNR